MHSIPYVKTSEMPVAVWKAFYDCTQGSWLEDGFMPWLVDGLASDWRRETTTTFAPDQMADHAAQGARYTLIDEWLRAQGATNGLRVLVEHG